MSRWVLGGKQHELGVGLHHLLRLGYEELLVVIQKLEVNGGKKANELMEAATFSPKEIHVQICDCRECVSKCISHHHTVLVQLKKKEKKTDAWQLSCIVCAPMCH